MPSSFRLTPHVREEGEATVPLWKLRLALEVDHPHPRCGSLGYYECRWAGCHYRREYAYNDHHRDKERPHDGDCPLAPPEAPQPGPPEPEWYEGDEGRHFEERHAAAEGGEEEDDGK